MNAFPIALQLKDGTVCNGLFVTDMTIATQFMPVPPSPNGVVYTGGPPSVTWTAAISNYLGLTSSLTLNVDALALPGAATVTLNGTLPSGWAFDGTNLTYNGTTVNATPTTGLSFTASYLGVTANSNTFSVQGSGVAATDNVAPTVPVALSATLASPSGVNLAWFPSNDPNNAGGWTGLLQGSSPGAYQLQRSVNGGAFSNLATVAAVTKGLQIATAPAQDIGSPAQAGSTVLSAGGSTFTMTGFGTQFYGTSDQGQLGGAFPVTGNFTATWCVQSCTNAGTAFGKCGLDCRTINPTDSVNGPGSAHVFAQTSTLPGGQGAGIDYRATQGASTSTIGLVKNGVSSNLYMMLSRSGASQNVWTLHASGNPALLATPGALVGSLNQSMPAQLYLTPACAGSGSETACVITNFCITQDNVLQYADTSANVAGDTYAYQVNCTDGNSNTSAYSAQTSVTISAGGLPAYITGLVGGGNVLVGQHTNYWDSNPLDTLNSLQTQTGQNPAIIGVGPDLNSTELVSVGTTGGTYGGIALANQFISQGYIVLVSLWPGNPLNGATMWGGSQGTTPLAAANFANITSPGTNEYNAFQTWLANVYATLKLINGPFLFRVFFEMDGTWFWYGNQSSTQFVAMWQLAHNYLAPKLPNMQWCFAPNYSVSASQFNAYYPGSSFVDLVGLDNYGNAAANSALESACQATGKPAMFFEFGAGLVNNISADSVNNLTSFQNVRNNYPYFIGCVWWCQSTALANQNNASGVMSNANAIVRSGLPSGI